MIVHANVCSYEYYNSTYFSYRKIIEVVSVCVL